MEHDTECTLMSFASITLISLTFHNVWTFSQFSHTVEKHDLCETLDPKEYLEFLYNIF